jgi:hypothetical protein
MEESMENEMQHESEATLDQLAARLTAAIERLEDALPRVGVSASNIVASEAVGPIVAMVEGSREAELAQKLAEAERTIAALRATASTHAGAHTGEGRRTLPVSLLAKQESGVAESSALDAALSGLSGSLSMEQRIAVKSQLLRAGLV